VEFMSGNSSSEPFHFNFNCSSSRLDNSTAIAIINNSYNKIHLLIRISDSYKNSNLLYELRGPFGKFADWRQCTAVIQSETVTFIPNCSGRGNVVVA